MTPPTIHGYSAADIERLARTAARIDRWRGSDRDDRRAAAHYAITEHLCTTTTPPTASELLTIGCRASDRYVADEMHHHGWDPKNIAAGGGALRGFQTYWNPALHQSPEDSVIDRIAHTQILPLLPPRQRQALQALADTDGDHRQAAAALGLHEGAYRRRLSAARRTILRWWHDGETPSGFWRKSTATDSRNGTCRGKTRLTVTQVEAYRDRKAGGALLRELAADAGCSIATMSRLLRGDTRAAPDRSAA